MVLARALLGLARHRQESEMQGHIGRERRAVLEAAIGDLQRVAEACALAGVQQEALHLDRIVLQLRPFTAPTSEDPQLDPIRT